jgi:hypothetical protein
MLAYTKKDSCYLWRKNMAEKEKGHVNTSYRALVSMSRLIYQKFGDDAIPIIRDVWYKMGLASGEILKKKLSACDFTSAVTLLDERGRKKMISAYDSESSATVPGESKKPYAEMGSSQISDRLYHITTPSGYSCDAGLEDSDHSLCEVVMSVNQGQLKALCGCDIEMNIVRSCIKGDDCCEIIYRPIDVSE